VCRVATYLPASQSSNFNSQYLARLAVDGDFTKTDPQMSPYSCAVTQADSNPWWKVDLGTPLVVTKVRFTNADYNGAYYVSCLIPLRSI